MESRIAKLEVLFEGLEKSSEDHHGEIKEQMSEIFERLRTLERMAWIAIGSTGAFGAIVTYFGSHIMGLLKS